MSYSFSIVASNKADAKDKIAAQFDDVVKNQPVHAIDRDAAQANAEAFLAVLADPSETQEISGSVSGYVSWANEGHFTSASASATFSLRNKE